MALYPGLIVGLLRRALRSRVSAAVRRRGIDTCRPGPVCLTWQAARGGRKRRCRCQTKFVNACEARCTRPRKRRHGSRKLESSGASRTSQRSPPGIADDLPGRTRSHRNATRGPESRSRVHMLEIASLPVRNSPSDRTSAAGSRASPPRSPEGDQPLRGRSAEGV
jgi:hypothetical protein